MTNTATDKIVAKVQALLNQADHPNTGKPEAAAFRAKAEQLMQQYRIDESEAIERGEAPSLKPTSKAMRVCWYSNTYRNEYFSLAHYVTRHTGVRYQTGHVRDNEGLLWLTMTLVGYESDVQFAELLYTSIRLAFAANLEPKYDSRESDMLNVWRMRNAGMTRDEIAEAMGWLVWDIDTNKRLMTPSAAADKASRLYGQACRELGAEPKLLGKGTSMKVYKEKYAATFVNELYYRLRDARNGADTERGALVLANRKQNVDEAFYEMFPSARPSTVPAERETAPVKEETEAQKARRWARAEREAQKQWEKDNSAAGRAGRQAGAQAARSVDLQGTQPTRRLG